MMVSVKKSHQQDSYIAIALVALVAATALLIYAHSITHYYPADSYFYLSKARNLIEGKGLTVNWNDGVDRKYFPGYSVVVGLVDFLSVGSVPPWFPLHILFLWASALLAFNVFKNAGIDSLISSSAVALFILHFPVMKWSAVPSAEPFALTAILASVWFFQSYLKSKQVAFSEDRHECTSRAALLYWLGACAAAGIAFATRAESIFLCLIAFAYIVMFKQRRHLPSPLMLIAGATLFVLPLLVWIVGYRGEGSVVSLSYFREFFAHLDLNDSIRSFTFYILSPLLTKNVYPQFVLFQLVIYIANSTAIVSTFWCMRGMAGRKFVFIALPSTCFFSAPSSISIIFPATFSFVSDPVVVAFISVVLLLG